MSALKIVLILLFSFLTASLFPNTIQESEIVNSIELIQSENEITYISLEHDHDVTSKKFFKIGKKLFRNPFYKSPDRFTQDKVSTVFIILLTGPLGGHRLYLGTKPIVPIVYAVTLGGGIGILPIIDMFVVIFTKDLSRYINNDRIIMWIE